jgi:hypothetical protein
VDRVRREPRTLVLAAGAAPRRSRCAAATRRARYAACGSRPRARSGSRRACSGAAGAITSCPPSSCAAALLALCAARPARARGACADRGARARGRAGVQRRRARGRGRRRSPRAAPLARRRARATIRELAPDQPVLFLSTAVGPAFPAVNVAARAGRRAGAACGHCPRSTRRQNGPRSRSAIARPTRSAPPSARYSIPWSPTSSATAPR